MSEKKVDLVKTYGVWPFSIWDVSDKRKWNNKIQSKLKERFGESTREETATHQFSDSDKRAYASTTSYFNPYLASIIVRSYSPSNGNVFDPFCSVTRPYISALYGRRYVGCEIRSEEAGKIDQILKHENVKNVDIHNTDVLDFETDEKFDLIFTCPPYWNLEIYSEDDGDLSNIGTYDKFLESYQQVFKKLYGMLKEDGFCVFVVGDFRDYSNGTSNINRKIPFVYDTIKSAENEGFYYYDKVIVEKFIGTAPSRVIMWNTRKTVNIHEEVVVLRKSLENPKWPYDENNIDFVEENPFW